MKYQANETNQKKCKRLLNSVQIQLRYVGFTKNDVFHYKCYLYLLTYFIHL